MQVANSLFRLKLKVNLKVLNISRSCIYVREYMYLNLYPNIIKHKPITIYSIYMYI